jgi:hypothetical protein
MRFSGSFISISLGLAGYLLYRNVRSFSASHEQMEAILSFGSIITCTNSHVTHDGWTHDGWSCVRCLIRRHCQIQKTSKAPSFEERRLIQQMCPESIFLDHGRLHWLVDEANSLKTFQFQKLHDLRHHDLGIDRCHNGGKLVFDLIQGLELLLAAGTALQRWAKSRD